MKISIDKDRCLGTGQCQIYCPDVFEVVDGLSPIKVVEPDQSSLPDVQDAIDGCPTQAIRLDMGEAQKATVAASSRAEAGSSQGLKSGMLGFNPAHDTFINNPHAWYEEMLAQKKFDVTRKKIYSLPFSAGPHTCLGAFLAKTETVTAIPA